jgi:hypothetical protein
MERKEWIDAVATEVSSPGDAMSGGSKLHRLHFPRTVVKWTLADDAFGAGVVICVQICPLALAIQCEANAMDLEMS